MPIPSGVDQKLYACATAVSEAFSGGDRFPRLGDWEGFTVRHEPIYHAQDVPTTLTAGYVWQFFGAQFQEGITNIPQPGYVPNDTIFIATHLRFEFLRGLSAAGAAQTGAEANGTNILASVADQAWLMDHASVNLQIGQRTVIRSVRGLRRFGGGTGMAVALATTATTTSVAAANNGTPDAASGYVLLPAYSIMPGDQIACRVSTPNAASRTFQAGMILQAVLDGVFVSKT